jgi:capsular exopolysaccharide synthesis family protein
MRDSVDQQRRLSGEQLDMASYASFVPAMAEGGGSLLLIARRGWWLILLSLLVAGAGAYVYLRMVQPKYASMSRVLVERLGGGSDRSTPVELGASSQDFVQTQAVLMTSPAVVTRAMRDPNVRSLPMSAVESHLQDLIGTLSATVGKSSNVIHLSASSPYPQDTATIVNAVVQSYIQWHRENRQLSAADLHKDLNRQLDERRFQLRAKRQERMTYEQRHPEVIQNTRGGILSQTLDLLKQELAAARVVVTERDSYYRGLLQYESDPNRFRRYVYSSPWTAAVEDTQRGIIELEVHQTERRLDEIAADVAAAQRSTVAFLRSRKAKLEQRLVELDAEYIRNHIDLAKVRAEDAVAREERLLRLYQNEFEAIQQGVGQNSEYAMIVAECDMLENLCNTLLKQINDLDLNSQRGLNIHVLQWASPSSEPSSPQVARVIGIALVLGAAAGTGLSLLRDRADQRVRSADEITALLGVPILGAVPSLPRRRMARTHPLRFAAHSHGVEAYRAIRTALLHGIPREQAVTILVTSPGPLEGKTTLVANLATAMACAGQQTLIIDADLRKPMSDRTFATDEPGPGLGDILAGRASLEEALRSTDIERLDVLSSGQDILNPSELLDSPAFAALLDELKCRYDRILIDSPPIGIVTDAQILSALCGLTLLVLRAQRTSRLLARQAREALRTVGARVVGAVVTDVPRRDTRYNTYRTNGHYVSRPAISASSPAGEEPSGRWTARPDGLHPE